MNNSLRVHHNQNPAMSDSGLRGFLKQWEIQAMVLPGILFLLVFSYIPMYGLIMAFQHYDIGQLVGFSQWAGLKHFTDLFRDSSFPKIMTNTIGISMLRLVLGFSAPILLAIMLNEFRDGLFKKTVQTVSYLPYFISWVAVSALVMQFLSSDGGMLNNILMSLNIIKEPVLFLGEPKYFWSIIALSGIWKDTGWSAIIYLAAIAAIDQELYQAASIDGAGRFRKIWHIVLPGIKPTIVIILIFSLGSMMNAGLDQVMLLGNYAVSDVSEIIDTYILKAGVRQMRFSYGTAIGLFKSVTNFILLFAANFICRKVSDTSLF